MTTKELIRAEVKRLFEKYQESERQASKYCDSCANEDIAFYQGKRKVCSEILSYLDTLPDEPVSDCHDLEKAKEEYVRKARRTPGHEWMTRDIEDAFIAGAEWQKRKMMEGSVEGVVCILPGYVAYVKEKNNESLKQYLLDNFKNGDEVSIIILPKEDAK